MSKKSRLTLSLIVSIMIILLILNSSFAIDESNTSTTEETRKVGTVDHIYNFSSGLARFENNGKYGYIDKKGFIVIEPKFDFAFDFRDDYARVIVDGKFGFIDKKGEYLIKPKFDINKYYVHDLIEGFAKINNKELEL